MNTEPDRDDLAVLCEGMSRDQIDRIHRLLYEWSAGPIESFPTQLALLTLAQFHAAARIPRSLADSRKLLEQHFAEYRRQSRVVADEFSSMANRQTMDLKSAGELQIQSLQQAVEQVNRKVANAETAAKRVIALLDSVTAVWENIKASTTTQCKHLEAVSNDLQDRFAWRVMLRSAAWFLLALGYGVLIGYCWHH